MTDRGVVLAETERIRDAILAADPDEPIADACRDDLAGYAYNREFGGYDGSVLLNVSTAILGHRRNYTRKPPTAVPVEFGEPPRSFIGKTIQHLLRAVPPDRIPSDAVSFERPRPMAAAHFCDEAEEYFEESHIGRSRRTLVIDDDSRSILFMKRRSAQTALNQRTIYVNGVKMPPGMICALEYDLYQAVPTDDPQAHALPLSAVERIAPLRVSAFAVPRSERIETFMRPEHIGNMSEAKEALLDYMAMLTFSQGVARNLATLNYSLPARA